MVISGDDLDALPIGLPGFYEEQLKRVLGTAGLGDETSQTRRVMEAIIAAQVPVYVHHELPVLSGVPLYAVLKLVSHFSQLLPVRDNNRVYIFHKSFADWLTRDKDKFHKPEFIVDRCAVHRRLASACGLPLLQLLSEGKDRFESDAYAVNALQRLVKARGCIVHDAQESPAFDKCALRGNMTHLVEAGNLEDIGLALLYSLGFLMKRAPQIHTLIADAALLLPRTTLIHGTLVLAQKTVRLSGTHWLAEELWQRLLRPAHASGVVELELLMRDARCKARSNLMFSARRAYLKPADSILQFALEGHSSSVNCVKVFLDAKGHTKVASCSGDTTVRIWDPIMGGGAAHVLEGRLRDVKSLTVFVDAKGQSWVASCSSDKTVRIWDPIMGGEAVNVLEGHSDCVNGVTAFVGATGHTWMACCSNDKTVRVWDPSRDGQAVYVFEGHSHAVPGVTAFLDAKGQSWLASCSYDKTVCIWDPLKSGEAVHVLEGHANRVNSVTAFVDAKGKSWVASCSDDNTVRVWDPTKGGEAVHVLGGHIGSVNGVTALMDATGQSWLASCSNDTRVFI